MGIGLVFPSTVSGKDIGCRIISFFVKQEWYNNVRMSIWDDEQIEGGLKCNGNFILLLLGGGVPEGGGGR